MAWWGRVLALSPEAHTLPELLRREGYATAAVVSHPLYGEQSGLAQGFESFVQVTLPGQHAELTSGRVSAAASEALKGLVTADQPFFLMVDYFDPHFPYRRHAEFDVAASGAGDLRGDESFSELDRDKSLLSDEEVCFLEDLYEEEVRYTDAAIGALLDEIRSSGAWDETVIVLTSTHGEEFLSHGRLGHGGRLYDPLLRVPLIVKRPASPAVPVYDELVTTQSLTPTILEFCGPRGREPGVRIGLPEAPARGRLRCSAGRGVRRGDRSGDGPRVPSRGVAGVQADPPRPGAAARALRPVRRLRRAAGHRPGGPADGGISPEHPRAAGDADGDEARGAGAHRPRRS